MKEITYNLRMPIYTIGYGNRPIITFLDLLKRYAIAYLVDTRSIPYSRFRPDYRKKALAAHLDEAGIGYLWLGEALGGKLLDPQYLVDGQLDLERFAAREDVRAALDRIENGFRQGHQLALMCAVLRPENCHRAWMLAPLLLARGLEVLHIDEQGDLKTQTELGALVPPDRS
jgi:uncharacterized protein (DUF488 family)